MKLAEALSIRADLQNRIDQLKSRLKYSAKVQEGDQPSEDVNELYKELDECLSQFEVIVYRINRTNMQTVHEGETGRNSHPNDCPQRCIEVASDGNARPLETYC